jgi:hypothetical protein
MGNTSSNFPRPHQSSFTPTSSTTTKLSGSEQRSDGICYSQTPALSGTFMSTGSRMPDLLDKTAGHTVERGRDQARASVETLVGDTTKGGAQTRTTTATMPTSAPNAEATTTSSQNVGRNRFERWRSRPKYARQLVWSSESSARETTVLATEIESPVPTPPPNELSNAVALRTIKENSHLFLVSTPINVDRFEQLLTTHPNRPYVQSVCRALREGFWPWAETDVPGLLTTWDNSSRPLKEEAHRVFAQEQRDVEVTLDQFSPVFRPDLLPGMFSMPTSVVPKPHSEKLRLVVDQSAKPWSQNSLIPKDVGSVRLDNVQDLGHILRRIRGKYPGRSLVLWKSDVSRAYRLMPMHPLWQIRQVVTIDSTQRHVDRRNNFGNRAGGRIYGAFAGLMLWIAIFVKQIGDLLGYVDDDYSWDFEDSLVWYPPYKQFYPEKQTRLLELWDELGIPHKKKKQE